MPRLSKLILAGAALGLLLLASLLVTSLTVELRGLRDRVVTEASARLPGAELSIGELHLSFFPLPHVVLERVSLSLPDVVRLEAQLASVYPRILPLLSGNLRLSRIRLSGIEASLRSPARQTDSATAPAPRSSPLTGLSAFVALQSPGITLIADGARLAMTPPESGAIWLESAEGVHLRARATDEGDGALLVEIDAGVSSLTLRHADARLVLGGGRLRATLAKRGEQVVLDVSEIGLEAPALEISGGMSVDPGQQYASLQVEGRDLEVAPILAAAEFLSDGADPVRAVAEVLRGGVVPELSVHAEGNDIGDLARLEAFLIRGRLQDGLVHVRAGALDLEETNGDVVIEEGVLWASDVTARVGRSSLAGGSLQLGLLGAAQIQLESREARLALDEIHARGTSIGWLPESWWSEARVAGTANLSHLSVSGPLNAPEAWRVSLEGAIQGFEVDSASWPEEAKLRAPLSFPEMRLLRENGRISVSGRAAIGGAEGEFDIVSTRGRLEVSRLRLRDAHSDATLRFSPGKDELEVGFSGKLRKKTLDALLVRNPLLAGSVEGDFQARLFPAKPLRSTAKGRFEATDLTLPGLARVHVEKLSLRADANGLNFDADADAPVTGKANLVGAIEFRSEGLVTDATLRGGDVDLGALLEAVGSEENEAARKEPDTTSPWRGFLRAKVDVHLDSLRYGRSHWKPFRADVELVPEGPVITVRQARACQITTDGAAAFAPSGVDIIDVSLTAKDAAIEQLASCLLGREDALTGTYDLEAQIRGEGESSELVRSLRGTVRLESRRGQIKNVPLIARTLAAISIATGSLGNLSGVQSEGLPYDRISLRGDLRKGELYLEEYVLEGPSVKMTGQGSVALADGKLDLTLMVAPLRTVDFAVGKIPLVGNILGGSLVSIPVAVKGEIGDPSVTPMDPSAVGAGLKRLAERTLRLPARALHPLLPGKRSK
jgi:AsmA-like C-terminal region